MRFLWHSLVQKEANLEHSYWNLDLLSTHVGVKFVLASVGFRGKI